MSSKRVLVAAGLLAVVLAASAAVPALRGIGQGADDVPTYVVQRGDFVRQIHGEGNLKAAEATVLGPPPELRRPLKIAWLAAGRLAGRRVATS